MKPDNSTSFNAKAETVPQQHSPVPYLFGGLAAMIGLVALALLILACSYWKFFSDFEGRAGQRDFDNSAGKPVDSVKIRPDLEEKILVIMAGDQIPTFLAKPISTKSSSFPDQNLKTQTQSEDEVQETHNQ